MSSEKVHINQEVHAGSSGRSIWNHISLFRSKNKGLDPGLNIRDVAAGFQPRS